VFCYSNADIRKGEEAEEIFGFIKFWTRQHGKPPQHLVFDSKLTTFEGLDRLDEEGIIFITLRRRSAALLKEIAGLPPSAWRTVTLNVPHRKYKTPRVGEQKACPREHTFRQFFIKDLGHDEPTILAEDYQLDLIEITGTFYFVEARELTDVRAMIYNFFRCWF
jgi:hypothetical protein